MPWYPIIQDALEKFREIEPADLSQALRQRFDIEHISKYFRSENYSFNNEALEIDPEDSILIEFTSLQSEFPELYHAEQYRLLLLLALHQVDEITTEISLELNTVRRKDNIDRIVVWSNTSFSPATLHSLKENKIDVIFLTEKDIASATSIAHYVPVQGKGHDYALALNLAADLLLNRLKKMFHLVLSEVAAPIYDSLYAKEKVATSEMMLYEEKMVRDVIQRFLPEEEDRLIAIDAGCGTGRHTFPLAKRFERVYAFDFSPLMIEAAEKKKIKADVRNVLFSVADLEYETIRDESQFLKDGQGLVNLIVAGFGLGSFIEDTAGMMRRFHSWLRDQGLVILSFYNEQTIVTEVVPNWRDTSLSAHLDTDSNTLRVELSPKTVFHIFCKAFNDEIRKAIMDSFDILLVSTYPTLMALMPNSLLQSSKALGIFRFVDETLSEHKDYKFGHYVTVVARKKSAELPDAHQRIVNLLGKNECEYELISHPPVVSTEDVKSYVDMKDGLPVKTLLFRRQDDRSVVAVVVPAKVRVDTAGLAKQMNVRRLYFGSDRDVLAAGFPLGGVAPFGFRLRAVAHRFFDRRLLSAPEEWVYTGAGDNSKTLKIKREDLLKVLEGYEEIDA